MQSHLRRQVVATLLGALVAGAIPASAWAQQNQARLTAEVPPGKFKTLRLRNVPAEAQVALAVKSSSRIVLSVLNEEDARRFPQVQEPILTAPVEQAMSFAVTIPTAGNYYVVFDNGKGTETAKVQMALRAARGARSQSPAPSTPPPESEDRPSPLRRQPGTHDM